MNRIMMIPLLLFFNIALAVNETGTGLNDLRLQVNDEQQVLLAFSSDEKAVLGLRQLEQGYAELQLDQYIQDRTNTRSLWGRAEVLVGCFVADLVIYRYRRGIWLEQASTQVAVDVCIEP